MENKEILSKIRVDYVRLPPSKQILAHEQETWELAYVINGSGIRTIGEMSEHFSAGEILLIPPGIRHHWMFDPADTDGEGFISDIALFFHTSTLQEISDNIPDLQKKMESILFRKEAVGFTGQRLLELQRLLRRLVEETEDEIRLIRMLHIFVLLASNTEDEEVKGYNVSKSKYQNKIDSIRIFCECNYMRQVSLTDAAKIAGMNTSSFCRFFHHNFGKTFVQHINHLRMEEARRQLLNKDKSVSSIAYDSGFTCVPYFNRLFHDLHGMSPSDYRKKMSVSHDSATMK